MIDRSSENPYLRYRRLLDSYTAALDAGWSDADFVALVERLDEAVAGVWGHGFVRTPLDGSPALADATGAPAVWVKNDTGNVGGSHKARHLFGVMLHQAVAGDERSGLAIASCGNAAVAAAVVAKAQQRPLQVFIPTWADSAVVGRLDDLDAIIEVCERRPGESGDPTYLRFLEAIDAGATPFSVQATVTPATIDGGRTLGWEAAEQLAEHGVSGRLRVFLQVGGGAMASAVAAGLAEAIGNGWLDIGPVYHPVQTEACAPLHRAWERLLSEATVSGPSSVAGSPLVVATLLAAMSARPDDFMWPWDPVGSSAATGILDDVAYDWRSVLEPTLRSGGWPIVVPEDSILLAHRLGADAGYDVSATGTAGLAGLVCVDGADPAVVLFTGRT